MARTSHVGRILVLIKPDAVERRLTGEILRRIEAKGYTLTALKVLTPTEQILARVYSPLHLMGDPFEETVATYLALGGSLEATARTLFVHANTVRYRLGRVSEQVGWDPTDSRDALMLHVAIIVARLVGADA